MSLHTPTDAITQTMASIEDVASCIEETFAQVGDCLGRGHSIFLELNGGLTQLSAQLSGAEIEGASVALQTIAARLNGLADALPSESSLLAMVGTNAAEASTLLRPLVKQIAMIMIIARSARIEAASLDGDRDDFLDFTQEAFQLARSVQLAVEACADEQKQLQDAVELALSEQGDFAKRYRHLLYSVGTELISAHSEMGDRQNKSIRLATLTNESTKKIAESVGSSIISLQAGDSARQRLEHIGRGLSMASNAETSIVPSLTDGVDGGISDVLAICQLQAAQLKETISEFDRDIGIIERSLSALSSDTNGIVEHGRHLFEGQGSEKSSFLVLTKEKLARASALIGTCENARKSVDGALSVVETTLGKFRMTISALSETVVDIILIGMNAGLKASHLGSQGRAFVVIANELKATADNISGGAELLKPVLDQVEKSSDELKKLRADSDPAHMASLESSIVTALREIEAGDNQLGRLINRVVEGGAQFEILMADAQVHLAGLARKKAVLPSGAARLHAAGSIGHDLSRRDNSQLEKALDELYLQYTMDSERVVHRQVLQLLGLSDKLPAIEVPSDDASSDDVLFF